MAHPQKIDALSKTERGVSASPPGNLLRAGIVGAGLMGRWHAEAVRRAGGRVVAVTDVNQDKAKHLASRYGGARSYSSMESMLNDLELDVLHICTPPSTHGELAEAGVKAGLHLLVEKPLTATAAEAERLLNLASDRGVLLCPIHQFVFQDGVMKAQEFLPRIGRVLHLGGVVCSAGGVGKPEDQWDEIVAEILPHPLSLMLCFLPNSLAGVGWKTMRPSPGELRAYGETSGTSLSIFVSMSARPTECTFQVVGTEGALHFNLFHGYSFLQPGQVSRARKIIHPFDRGARHVWAASTNLARRIIQWQPAYPGLEQLIDAFYHAVRTRTGAPISREDSLAVSRARDCLIQISDLIQEPSSHPNSR